VHKNQNFIWSNYSYCPLLLFCPVHHLKTSSWNSIQLIQWPSTMRESAVYNNPNSIFSIELLPFVTFPCLSGLITEEFNKISLMANHIERKCNIQEPQLSLVANKHSSISFLLQCFLLLVTSSFPKQACGGIHHI
jgi:hypothetical protein